MTDLVDRASEIEQLQWDQALARHKKNKLRPKQHFSVRLCMECERVIPKSRLKALPEATHCIDCQSVFEHHQKNYRKSF